MSKNDLITFGPIPSRRLGRSLGINNIPPKICTYSCVYCQVGRTLHMQVNRELFYKPEEILRNVEKKVKNAQDKGERIDYLTFVSDGEPILDSNLDKEIELLKTLGIKIAVITNASLIWQENVRDDLCKADWVSCKIDTVSKDIWRRINRPHKTLQLDKILQGITEFSRTFKGEMATETMLIQGINDNTEEIEKIAHFIAGLKKTKSYISIPTRPPAEKWVVPATENSLNTAYWFYRDSGINVECITGYEGNAFAFTGDVEEDLLSITSVHPMRQEAVEEFLKKSKTNWHIIEQLINENKLVEVEYKDKKFYMRKL